MWVVFHSVCVCVCACVRACVRACVCVCARACVRVCVQLLANTRVRVRLGMCIEVYIYYILLWYVRSLLFASNLSVTP